MKDRDLRCILCDTVVAGLEKGSFVMRGLVCFCEKCYVKTFVPPGQEGDEYLLKLFRKEGSK